MRAFLEKQNRPGSHRKPHQPKKGSRQTTIQRKAAISGPNDIHEKEADRAAEQITRSREQAPQTICPCGGGCPNCSTGKKSRNQPLLQPKSLQPSNSREIEVPESVDKVLSRPGDPLDRETRNDLEPRFGSDFSSVRLHHDSLAARSAKDIGARAYTVGSDIVFGAGQYAAGSSETRHLLAHELAHVVQQSQSVGNQQFIQRQTDGSDDTARPAAPAATNASLSQAFIGFACEAVSNIRTGVEEGRAWGFENVATLRSDASGGADLFAARQQALQELVWTLAEMIEGLEAGSIVPTEPATFGTMRELWISRNPDMIPGTDQWATLFPNEILPPEIAQPEYPGIYINISMQTKFGIFFIEQPCPRAT